MSNIATDTISYLTTGANWSGPNGFAMLIGQHLGYTAATIAMAAVVALPIGLYVGHTGRGEVVVVGVVNVLRSLPTLGLLLLFILWMGLGLFPTLLALAFLAVPPILAGAYSGVANVDRIVVDASVAMGHSGPQVLRRVELPNAAPLLLGGVRSATLQVIATATIAAYAGLGGLGRPIFDGLAVYDYPMMIGGSLLVTALALVVDALLAATVWVSAPGSGRLRRVPEIDTLGPVSVASSGPTRPGTSSGTESPTVEA